MRQAHLLAPLWLAALLAASPLSRAQTTDGHAPPSLAATSLASALDPAAPQLPLRHAPLAPSGAIATDIADWREAHAAVAEFPRGHIDILRWEAEQAGRPTMQPSGQGSHRHGGQP